MKRTFTAEITKLKGKEVELYGWVHGRRDHGKLIFIDLRDREGLIQVVFKNDDLANSLRLEYVIKVKGEVKERPESMINENIPTGKYEISATSLEIINASTEIPIPVDGDGYDVGEEVRMKYRYLDLRRDRLAKNLTMRHKVVKQIRDFLTEQGFIEVETPILTKSTPEGARDYLVPARLQKGSFYALPQSPQQYKQLLMVAGLEKYFQIARCFRDEDTRGDRQPEFTQLDLEMSFVGQEEVMALNEKLLIEIVTKLYPEKKIQETPFPRISYKEAIKKYKTDRPDLRKDKENPDILAFCWVVDFPFFEKTGPSASSGQAGSGWSFTHNPFSAPKAEFMDDLMNKKNVGGIIASQYDVVLNGWEIGGGSLRNHKPEALKAVFDILGYKDASQFTHMFTALESGAPPHGGIAWGLDRLVMILQNEPNIREVIAFPKTGDGRDLMMEAPSEVDKKQLDELGLKLK
ncbi:MAG: aspartate--tRNA ligase [bacterium]|nr:aspartate--tRNA ligase [bacterium]